MQPPQTASVARVPTGSAIDWPRFAEIVRGHERFLLTSHIKPDCDALGSELGLAGVLAGGAYADDVRTRVRHWQARGIASVPAVIVDDRWLIGGAQPADVYEDALRQAAAARAPTAA